MLHLFCHKHIILRKCWCVATQVQSTWYFVLSFSTPKAQSVARHTFNYLWCVVVVHRLQFFVWTICEVRENNLRENRCCNNNLVPYWILQKIESRSFIFAAGASSAAAFWYCSRRNRSDNSKFFHQRAEQTLHLSCMDMTAFKTWWKRKNKNPWSGVI